MIKKIIFCISIFLTVIGALSIKDEIFSKEEKIISKEIGIAGKPAVEIKENYSELKFKSEIKELEGMIISAEGFRDSTVTCGEGKYFKCASIDYFMKLCGNVSDISKATFKSFKYPYAFPDKDVEYLLDNGGYKGFNIYSTAGRSHKDEPERPACKLEIQVEGIYKGSQVSKRLVSYVTSFVINKGEVLVFNTRENGPY